MLTTAVQAPRLHFRVQDGYTAHIRIGQRISRIESISAPVPHNALAAYQAADDEVRTILVAKTALRLEKHFVPGTTLQVYCDTSAGKSRPYVPAPLRRQVFQSLHIPAHPGTKEAVKLV
jgi:hypothetical protein